MDMIGALRCSLLLQPHIALCCVDYNYKTTLVYCSLSWHSEHSCRQSVGMPGLS